MSVLLVEDDPLIREFVVEVLREAGYHVIHASTGEEALAWCKRHVADVLVTDIRLPERSTAGRSRSAVASPIRNCRSSTPRASRQLHHIPCPAVAP
ncbi:response regulator [Bradyrhizobium sp. CB1650]|uniref:response regulator n=1 Tax=Bradyrhizobium sp. CB1650 TaxID=3039153 RepID=UPI002434B674|nr:response regulator [Bradyrhizobium sp. CB1650]WGD55050.1 response regulator [Bradyrhizobium sp. CB1650]